MPQRLPAVNRDILDVLSNWLSDMDLQQPCLPSRRMSYNPTGLMRYALPSLMHAPRSVACTTPRYTPSMAPQLCPVPVPVPVAVPMAMPCKEPICTVVKPRCCPEPEPICCPKPAIKPATQVLTTSPAKQNIVNMIQGNNNTVSNAQAADA